MTCHLQYCHNCQTDPVSLLSVLGCNIYDEHETEHHHEPANESSDEDETQALSMSEILILKYLRKTAGSIRTIVVWCVVPKGE